MRDSSSEDDDDGYMKKNNDLMKQIEETDKTKKQLEL